MELLFSEVDGNVLIVSADGGLDSKTADEFIDSIYKLIDVGITRIIIDCQRLSYVSSAGLAVLVRLHKRMADRGGDVKIAAVPGPFAQVLALTRLDRVFSIYDDVNRARLACREESEAPAVD